MFLFAVSLVLAAPLPTVLSFSGDGSCGDERAVRDAITVRLGRDPFRDGTPGPRFLASITRQAGTLSSSLSVDGGAPRKRTSADCRELLQSLALAIALVLEAATPPPPPAEPPAPPPPAPAAVVSVSPALFASGGVSPHLTAGAAVALGVRVDRFVADLEVRFDVPAATTLNGTTFRSFPVLVTAAPGLAVGPVRLSAPFSFGGLFVSGASAGSSVLALGGVQASVVIALGNRWFLEPFLRAQASFVRVTVLSGTTPVWTTWPIAGLAGVAVRHEFGQPATPGT
ncbi:MAG: hypothetical protein JNJ54_15160 [Myxococcaceae bacterium]|nr:hypothetical protein [Myxococcaceae bacterium]